jgi:hypothetical protein
MGLVKFLRTLAYLMIVCAVISGVASMIMLPEFLPKETGSIITIIVICAELIAGCTGSMFFFVIAEIVKQLVTINQYLHMLNQKTMQLDNKVSTIEDAYNAYRQRR